MHSQKIFTMEIPGRFVSPVVFPDFEASTSAGSITPIPDNNDRRNNEKTVFGVFGSGRSLHRDFAFQRNA
jgi:hypothetical protein